jgi:hypothetical protein
MAPEQYKKITDNQIIIDKKLDKIMDEIDTLRNDVSVSLKNQILLEEYEMEIIKRLKRIQNSFNK